MPARISLRIIRRQLAAFATGRTTRHLGFDRRSTAAAVLAPVGLIRCGIQAGRGAGRNKHLPRSPPAFGALPRTMLSSHSGDTAVSLEAGSIWPPSKKPAI